MRLLTVFANIRVDDAERFQRMKDSFDSFYAVDADWVINIRGCFAAECEGYISARLGGGGSITSCESGRGWIADSRELLPKIHTKYVLVWIEDHICTSPVEFINAIVSELDSAGVEYLNHTWYFNGLIHDCYKDIPKKMLENISYFILTRTWQRSLKLNDRRPFIISMPSIFSFGLFSKILTSRHPYLRRWPKETPFDFEKGPDDYSWLPLKMAIPHREIFACVDDDNGVVGYSLQSRGLYAIRENRNRETRQARWQLARRFLPDGIFMIAKRFTYHL